MIRWGLIIAGTVIAGTAALVCYVVASIDASLDPPQSDGADETRYWSER